MELAMGMRHTCIKTLLQVVSSAINPNDQTNHTGHVVIRNVLILWYVAFVGDSVCVHQFIWSIASFNPTFNLTCRNVID